jgi:cell division septation protein DedD
MKRGDVRKPSSVFYIGKGLIVASIVITASLGFLLGFFVGKKFQPLSETQSASMVLPEGPDQFPQEAPGKESLPQQPELSREQNDKPLNEQQETTPVKALRDTGTIPSEKRHDKPQSTPSSKTTHVQETKPASGSSQTKQTAISTDKLQPTVTSVTRKYTVQIGAFKNPEEADALRNRMSKKGYKAFVTTAKTKKQEILHKVMVGTYTTRKEAEVLSIKLKNSEGLRTFVTFFMQEGTTRHR